MVKFTILLHKIQVTENAVSFYIAPVQFWPSLCHAPRSLERGSALSRERSVAKWGPELGHIASMWFFCRIFTLISCRWPFWLLCNPEFKPVIIFSLHITYLYFPSTPSRSCAVHQPRVSVCWLVLLMQLFSSSPRKTSFSKCSLLPACTGKEIYQISVRLIDYGTYRKNIVASDCVKLWDCRLDLNNSCV